MIDRRIIQENDNHDSDKEKILIDDETIYIQSISRIRFNITFAPYHDNDSIFFEI